MVLPSFIRWEEEGGKQVDFCQRSWVIAELSAAECSSINYLHKVIGERGFSVVVDSEIACSANLCVNETFARVSVHFKPYHDEFGNVRNFSPLATLQGWAQKLALRGIQSKIFSDRNGTSLLVPKSQQAMAWQLIAEDEAASY